MIAMLLLAPIKGLLKKNKYTVGDYFKSFSLGISLVFFKKHRKSSFWKYKFELEYGSSKVANCE